MTGPWPDPCSRFQPQGVHGPSQVVDPDAFEWTDAQWRGVRLRRPGDLRDAHRHVHAGRHIRRGGSTSFDTCAISASRCSRSCRSRNFPGAGTGATTACSCSRRITCYGDHEAFKRFVDRAHALGLAVILDVVYNHLGPDGNYLKCFSPHYFSRRYQTDWGERAQLRRRAQRTARATSSSAMRATGSASFISMVCVSTRRSRSSTTASRTCSPSSTQRARAAAQPRTIIMIAENEPQHARASAAGRARRLRHRRDVERRLPPRRARRADRQPRRLLPRLHRSRAGIPLLRAPRLPVSGPVVRVAEASRAARRCTRTAGVRRRHLPAEPRSGRQHVHRRSPACATPRPAAIAR